MRLDRKDIEIVAGSDVSIDFQFPVGYVIQSCTSHIRRVIDNVKVAEFVCSVDGSVVRLVMARSVSDDLSCSVDYEYDLRCVLVGGSVEYPIRGRVVVLNAITVPAA